MSHLSGGLIMLKELLPSLPPSEQKIAQYIISNPNEAILLTSLMLGEKSQTSSAAVIRLCKSLGFKSFQELKLRIAGDLQSQNIEEFRDIEPDENVQFIIEKVTSNTVQSIKETVDIINTESIETAVTALIQAKSIVFLGFGASHIAAMDAEQKFLRINKQARAFSDTHNAATSIANKGPEDVVIGISFSGETNEVVKLLELAKQQGAKTISLTKYGKSTVSKLSDIQLHTSAAKEASFRSAATASRMAQLHIIDILFMCLASAEYEETVKHLDKTRKAISYLKDDSPKRKPVKIAES